MASLAARLPSPSPGLVFGAAVAIRLALLLVSRAADALSADVRYTDVDYDVFTDGARAVAGGGSPYDRATYRYPPALAWALVPGVRAGLPEWGKALFCAADLASGWLAYSLLRAGGSSPRSAAGFTAAFLLHPYAINVSTRGNGDGLVTLPLLGCLWLLGAAVRAAGRGGRCADAAALAAAGACYGAAVHLKLYPAVYALPLGVWALTHGVQPQPPPPWALRSLTRLRWGRAVIFAAGAAVTFGGLGAASYAAYGHDYLRHAVLYHGGRTDPRHNFAPAFLPQYYALGAAAAAAAAATAPDVGAGGVSAAAPTAAAWLAGGLTSPRGLALAAFVPQLGLCAFLGARFAAAGDLPFALLAQTAAFVALNRVATVQYLHWVLALVPLALPRCAASLPRATAVHAAWLLVQLAWNAPAGHLELRSQSVHAAVWAGSLAFLAANAGVLAAAVAAQVPPGGSAGAWPSFPADAAAVVSNGAPGKRVLADDTIDCGRANAAAPPPKTRRRPAR
jgi:GPI mannosyltransferase 1 subunit M